ncbi:MAG: hypothetical protein JW726_08890 [Anaerolineales bacterium]|nr:hypothetical protein [Anaerolineales bacterium]
MNSIDPLELLWDALLSRDGKQVQSTFSTLEPDNQQTILQHLKRMATEPDWHPEQALSARAALSALGIDL